MTGIDQKLITRKLASLKDYLNKLQEFKGLDRKSYLSDHHYYGLAEHYQQQAIEAVLDLARHLIVVLGLKTPEMTTTGY